MTCSVGSLFDEKIRQENPSDWEMVDKLEGLFPEPVKRIQECESDLKADGILVSLLDQIPSDSRLSENEKRQLLTWLKGLRFAWLSTPEQPTQGEIERRAKQAADVLRQR
jgi:hypothetical protein